MAKTTGMVVVAAFAAGAPGLPPVIMTATRRPTKSDASAASRPYWPSAHIRGMPAYPRQARYQNFAFAPRVSPCAKKLDCLMSVGAPI